MNNNQFMNWYRTNIMNNGNRLELREFALVARGEQVEGVSLTSANNWRRYKNTYNTDALQWLANNWNITSKLTIALPNVVWVRNQLVFRRGVDFKLKPWSSATTFKIESNNFNNNFKSGDLTSAIVFRDSVTLTKCQFERTGVPINILRIEAPNGQSTIRGCDFEGYGGLTAITSAAGSLRMFGTNFSNAPGGTTIRFYNISNSATPPNLEVNSNNLYHIAAGSTGVKLGITNNADSSSFNLGNITIDGCTMDIGGTILDANFSRETSIGNLLIQYNSLSDNIKSQEQGVPSFAIGVRRSGSGKVTFDNIRILDNMININKSDTAIYFPDKVEINNDFVIKGMTMINSPVDNNAFPIIIHTNMVKNGIVKVCGIVTNFANANRRGISGIGSIKNNTITPLDQSDYNGGQFEVAG